MHNTKIYEKLKLLESDSDHQIKLDIPRTYADDPFF